MLDPETCEIRLSEAVEMEVQIFDDFHKVLGEKLMRIGSIKQDYGIVLVHLRI